MNPRYGKDYRDTLDALKAAEWELLKALQQPCPPVVPVAECPSCRRVDAVNAAADRLTHALLQERP